jgi:cytochrome c oxidase subunit 2
MRRFWQHRYAAYCALASIAALLVSLGPSHADEAEGGRVIKIVAQRFHYTPNEIDLKRGEPVTLEFTSLDFLHGFKVPALGVRVNLLPGRPTLVHITPDKTGRFVFLCDNFCGVGHEEMNGVIVVTE